MSKEKINNNLAKYMVNIRTDNANSIQIYNAWVSSLSDEHKKNLDVKTAIHCLDYIELSKTEYEKETGKYLKEG